MKNRIIFSVLLLLTGCKGNIPEAYFSPEKAASFFKDIESICNRDGGDLWGKNLYGPLMFVDRTNRKIFANQPDNDGLLTLKDGIYTGFYPKEVVINTTCENFGGVLFGIAPIPTEENDYLMKIRAINSLFHRFQQTSGINPQYFNVVFMDEKQARIWLKLEWKALKKAIGSEGEDKVRSIRDALIFRGSNHESYPGYVRMGNSFETNKGLATFTSMLLTSRSPEEFKSRLFDYLDLIYSFQSYATSYGSVHGALYATLLHTKGFDFKVIVTDTLDMGRLVRDLYQIELPLKCRDVAGSIAMNYDIEDIYREEEQRLKDIKEKLDEHVINFSEKPVVLLELESPSFDFEPENIHFLDTLGILYHTLRISDNWGKLSVDEGECLVSNNYKYLRISAKGLKNEKNHLQGEGWQITLNNGWEITEAGKNFLIRQAIP
jgi:hypothetical protein